MSKKGFTLTELVIVTLLVSILSGIALQLVAAGFNSWFLVVERRNLVQHARVTVNHLVRNLQSEFAMGLYHSGVSNGSPPGNAAFNVGQNQITFARVSQDTDGLWSWEMTGADESVGYWFFPDGATHGIDYRWWTGAAWSSANLENVLVNDAAYRGLRYFKNKGSPPDFSEIVPSTGVAPYYYLSASEINDIGTVEITITNQTSDGQRTFATKTLVFPRNEGRPAPYSGP